MNPTCIFLHALFWVLGTIQERSNQTTKPVTFTFGVVQRTLWASCEVQAKPYEPIKNAASRHFLGIPLFKVSEWIFSWNWNLRLHLKTIHPKYQIFDAFREKCLSLSKKFHLVFSMKYSWKKNLEDLFMGVHTIQMVLKHGTTENTQIWCFNLHLILDVSQHSVKNCMFGH